MKRDLPAIYAYWMLSLLQHTFMTSCSTCIANLPGVGNDVESMLLLHVLAVQIILSNRGRAAANAWAAQYNLNFERTDSRSSVSKPARQESFEGVDSRPSPSTPARQESARYGNAVGTLPPRHPVELAKKASRSANPWAALASSPGSASDAGSERAANAGQPFHSPAFEAQPSPVPLSPCQEEPTTESLLEELLSQNSNAAPVGDQDTAAIQPLLDFVAPMLCPISKVWTAVGLDSPDSSVMRAVSAVVWQCRPEHTDARRACHCLMPRSMLYAYALDNFELACIGCMTLHQPHLVRGNACLLLSTFVGLHKQTHAVNSFQASHS